MAGLILYTVPNVVGSCSEGAGGGGLDWGNWKAWLILIEGDKLLILGLCTGGPAAVLVVGSSSSESNSDETLRISVNERVEGSVELVDCVGEAGVLTIQWLTGMVL